MIGAGSTRISVCLLAGMLASCAATDGPQSGPHLMALAPGHWVKIHEQRIGDDVVFVRQRHAGSAFDTKRGRLILFGSDTHGRDWSNAPLFFDVAKLRWTRFYPDDDVATYRVDSFGRPVAGRDGDHPWAMHTFGLVVYDSRQDALIVISHPAHLEPGRFTDTVAHVWPRIRSQPVWSLDLASGRWTALDGPDVPFFAHAAVFDPYRGTVIGYRPGGIYEFSPTNGVWRKLAERGLLGWGSNAVFDTRHRALVVFGSHERRNDVVVFYPATGRHRRMPTPGPRPPRAAYAPMAYHTGIDRTVVLVGRGDSAVVTDTWLYDLEADTWTRLAGAGLPFSVGMNYNLEYDPSRALLLLVANPPGQPTAVWALRLE